MRIASLLVCIALYLSSAAAMPADSFGVEDDGAGHLVTGMSFDMNNKPTAESDDGINRGG